MAQADFEWLKTFLSKHNCVPEDLLSEVEDVYGEPRIVIATGSILSGFGNKFSDLDVFVVVENSNLTALPITSYKGGLRVDTEYYGVDRVFNQEKMVRSGSCHRSQVLSRDLWVQYYRSLRSMTRFYDGYRLSSKPEFFDWLDQIKSCWLESRVSEWFTYESCRHYLAANWLKKSNMRLACNSISEALFSALSAKVAEKGQVILPKKWLGEKLKACAFVEYLEMFKKALRYPVSDVEQECYFSDIESFVLKLVDLDKLQHSLSWQLWCSPGVQIDNIKGECIVSRWNMRGVLLDSDIGLGQKEYMDCVISSGKFLEQPEDVYGQLFANDMLWLSVVEN